MDQNNSREYIRIFFITKLTFQISEEKINSPSRPGANDILRKKKITFHSYFTLWTNINSKWF